MEKNAFGVFQGVVKKNNMKDFYNPDPIPGVDLGAYNGLGFFGITKSGKGTLMNNLLMTYYIHKVLPENIYVMSPTFEGDDTFDSFRMYLKNVLGSRYSSHVFQKFNPEKIEDIDNAQQKILSDIKEKKYCSVYGLDKKRQAKLKSCINI